MGKTWKDSQYKKVRLPKVPGLKVFKDARFPSRNNERVKINREKENDDVVDDASDE